MTDADGPWPDRRLRGLIDECAGAHVTDLVETAGEQGASGARLRYFHGASGGEALRFVAKFATRLERQAIRLLDGQGQAVPHSACSPNVAGRDWLVMEHTDEIPYGDSETGPWPARLGAALAEVHAANLGRRPDWLPALPSSRPLKAVFAEEWIDLFAELMASNATFRATYGAQAGELEASWRGFQAAVHQELRQGRHLTLISTDMTPSHWRQLSGRPVFIDWEQARFGPLYLDLPNMFDHTTVRHYYAALLGCGISVPRDEFADSFTSLSRYLGFRYLSVGLEFWLGTNTLGSDYWESAGASFFEKCLQIARVGYPRPDL